MPLIPIAMLWQGYVSCRTVQRYHCPRRLPAKRHPLNQLQRRPTAYPTIGTSFQSLAPRRQSMQLPPKRLKFPFQPSLHRRPLNPPWCKSCCLAPAGRRWGRWRKRPDGKHIASGPTSLACARRIWCWYGRRARIMCRPIGLQTSRGARPKVGTRLVRRWHDVTYQVTVTEAGYSFDGNIYSSLTPIARVITGAHWSETRLLWHSVK